VVVGVAVVVGVEADCGSTKAHSLSPPGDGERESVCVCVCVWCCVV
jgi:hypothetical protein